MKIKSILMLATGALLSASTLTANAAVVKKDPKDVKIYINPGHGGWNGNCRPMGTVKHGANLNDDSSVKLDTTNFFESNTNLWKCLAMYHKLVDYGVPEYGTNALFDANNYKNQHLVMSRIENGNSTDRGLSTDIALEVEKYSPDIFISVHSNASPDGTIGSNENYPLVIYRGEDYRSTAFTDTRYGKNWDYAGTGLNGAGSSYEFSKLVYSHLATIKHEPYTTEWKDQYVSGYTPLKTEHNVRGDVNLQDYFNLLNNGSFTLNGNRGSGTLNTYSNKTYYGFYGVMKHGAVGCLSEGYMHTYYPSVNRHMNKDVCAIEGISYAHAIADYFGWEKEKTGYIYGIVRDRNQTFTHTYYIPNQSTDDIYKPLNNCTVYLCDKYGNRLYNSEKPETAKYKYVTDDEYNGAFVFYDLEPGDYTLDYECTGYQAASQGLKSTVVTVKANEISYPKAFLNAEGFSYDADTKYTVTKATDWGQTFTNTYLTGSSYYFSAAVSNNWMYTAPAPTSATQMITKAYNSGSDYASRIFRLLTAQEAFAFSQNATYFPYPGYSSSTTSFYGKFFAGPAIATDTKGNLYFSSYSISNANSNNYWLSWADKIGAIMAFSANNRPTASNSVTPTNIILKSSYTNSNITNANIALTDVSISYRADIMSAYGDGLGGIGYLWFAPNNAGDDGTPNYLKLERITLNKGSAKTKTIFNSPSEVTTQHTRSRVVQYDDDKVFYNEQNSGAMYKGVIINDETITWTNIGLTNQGSGATMFMLNGREMLVYSSSTTTIKILDVTDVGNVISMGVYTPFTSASKSAQVRGHFINVDNTDDYNANIYIFVPGVGTAKYTLTDNNISVNDPVAVTGVVGSTEAEVVANNYEPNITVTWEAPDSWTQQPTNYLVQYRMHYTKDDGTVTYINYNSEDASIATEAWYTAGFTEDATCKFVHEGAEFVSSSSDKKIYPLTYEYRIIPNFNCYDGEVSAISGEVTIDFVVPEPEWSSFTIEPVIEDNELKQYDATAIWYGVDFESNKEFSLQGYKLELFRSEDTEKNNPVASFSFKTNDSKYFGTLTENVGAVLDENGNVIENLTYSKVVNPSTGKTINQFHYNAYDLDVLDVNDNGTAEGKEFTAQVTAEFWIVDSEFAYGVDDIPVTCKNAYTPVAPNVKQPVVKYYATPQWSDWDGDGYGDPAKGVYDSADGYWKVYWVNMDITKPNAEVPVSSYTLTLASKGKSDVNEVMLYDPNGSLGLPVITEGYATGYVALPVNVAAETYSTRSTVEATSATFTIPGNYDFSQTEAANVPMVTFYVKDFDITKNGGTTDIDGDNSALNYTYTVAANYASGNTAISSTATGGANPVDGGITTAVEEIEVAGAVNNVVVYPVPATVSVTIKAAEAIEQVAIYSAAGAVVKSLQGDGECAMTIAVDDLEVGTYFVRVNNLAPVKIAKN